MELHKFDPAIYPYKLWIAICETPQNIEDQFYDYEGNPIKDLTKSTKSMGAFAMPVTNKEDNEYGVVVYFRNRKGMNFDFVTHECSHAAKYLCEHVDIDTSWHEPFEYIAGWMAKCCEEVKKKKAEKA